MLSDLTWLNNLAKSTGFLKRTSKITPKMFVDLMLYAASKDYRSLRNISNEAQAEHSMHVSSVSKKTTLFQSLCKKTSKTRLSKFLKSRSLQVVNDCFKNESNAVFGVFLQRLSKQGLNIRFSQASVDFCKQLLEEALKSHPQG